MPDQAVLSVTGDIDLNSAAQLRAALSRPTVPAARRVAVDLSGVPFIATDGISVLLDAGAVLRPAGGSLVLACAQPPVARALSLIGADQLIPVVATIADVLALWATDRP